MEHLLCAKLYKWLVYNTFETSTKFEIDFGVKLERKQFPLVISHQNNDFTIKT